MKIILRELKTKMHQESLFLWFGRLSLSQTVPCIGFQLLKTKMHQESFFPLVWSLVFVADCPMILDFSFECRLGLRLFRPCRWQTCFSMKLYNGLWALSRVDVGLSMAPVICRCTKINEMLLLSAILFIPITTTEWARIDLYHFLLCSLKNDLWQREVAGG